jgi:hypothetical protein
MASAKLEPGATDMAAPFVFFLFLTQRAQRIAEILELFAVKKHFLRSAISAYSALNFFCPA